MHRSVDIDSILHDWAIYATTGQLNPYPTTTPLGRAMNGLPSTSCGLCKGKGKEEGHKCERCNGTGRIKISATAKKINPAFIMPTLKDHTPKVSGSHIIRQCDIAVRQLDILPRNCVVLEYTETGTQWRKAKIIGITQSRYSRALTLAHIKIKHFLLDNTA